MSQSPTIITRLSRVEASLEERLVTYYGVCLARMYPTRRHLYQRRQLLPSLLATHLEHFGPLTDVPVSISVCIKFLNALSYKTSFHGTIIWLYESQFLRITASSFQCTSLGSVTRSNTF